MNNFKKNYFDVFPKKGFLNTQFQIITFEEDLEFQLMYNYKVIDSFHVEKQSSVVLNNLAKAGEYILLLWFKNETGLSKTFEVEDAIRLGGSKLKASYVFDNIDYAFLVMFDRMYIYNIKTQSTIEINYLTPDNIRCSNNGTVLLSSSYKNDFIYSILSLNSFSVNDLELEDKEELFFDKTENKLYLYDKNLSKFEIYALNHEGFCLEKEINNVEQCEFLSSPLNLFYIYTTTSLIVYSIEKHFEKQFDSKEIIATTLDGFLVQKNKKNIYSFSKIEIGEYEIKVSPVNFIYYNDFDKINIERNFFHTEIINYPEELFNENIEILKNDHKVEADKYLENGYSLITIDSKNKIKYSSVSLNFFPSEKGIYIFERINTSQLDKFVFRNNENAKIIKENRIIYRIIYATENTQVINYFDDNINILFSKAEKLIFNRSGKLESLFKGKYEGIYTDIINKENANKTFEELIDTKKRQLPMGVVNTYSNSIDRLISIFDDKLIFWEYNNKRKLYDDFEIVIDNSSYQEAFLSPDGRFLMNKNKKNVYEYYNIETQETEKFFSEKFIKFNNENALVFDRTDEFNHTRKALIKDPSTFEEITPDYYHFYQFCSPDEKLFAQSELKKRVFLKIGNGKEISGNEYRNLLNTIGNEFININCENSSLTLKLKNRKEIFNKHSIFFKERSINEYNHVTVREIIDVKQYAVIGINGSDKLIEIEIPKLNNVNYKDYLNYIAFSYDNEYVGIVGKIGSNGYINIAKLMFDEDKCTLELIENNEFDTSRAVWSCGFSINNLFASYDSDPDSYILRFKDEMFEVGKNNNIVPSILGENFICFSPSGKYMAFSKQAYHPISLGGTGHQPSNKIFIHSTDNGFPCIKKYSDHGDNLVLNQGKYGIHRNLAFIAFSIDDKRLMSISEDGVILIRNLDLQ